MEGINTVGVDSVIVEDDSRITEVVGIGLGARDPVDRELVKIIVLVLGEDVGNNS